MVELVDTHALGACAARREGSSPFSCTIIRNTGFMSVFFISYKHEAKLKATNNSATIGTMRINVFIKWFYISSFLYLLLVMFLLPAFSYPGYDILVNTTSQLGAQHSPNDWVMNSAFTLMGISTMLAALHSIKKQKYIELLPFAFGFCFILVALFQHEPGTSGLAYDATEALLHSIFATAMGIIISVYAFIRTVIAATNRDRFFAAVALTSASGLSFLMYQVPEYTGILQRLMFIAVLIWLGYLVAQRNDSTQKP